MCFVHFSDTLDKLGMAGVELEVPRNGNPLDMGRVRPGLKVETPDDFAGSVMKVPRLRLHPCVVSVPGIVDVAFVHL